MGHHFPLQGISATQGLNPGFLHCMLILYPLSHCGSLGSENTDPEREKESIGSLDCVEHYVRIRTGLWLIPFLLLHSKNTLKREVRSWRWYSYLLLLLLSSFSRVWLCAYTIISVDIHKALTFALQWDVERHQSWNILKSPYLLKQKQETCEKADLSVCRWLLSPPHH